MKASDYRLIVTSGPTREWLDPVRFLTNASTGRTGWCLAQAGVGRFAEVELISGPVCRKYRTVDGARVTTIESTADMAEAVESALGQRTLLIMAAAPADYTPAEVATSKMKKSASNRSVALLPTVDVLASTASRAASFEHCYRVGFAAETDHLEENAREKLERKSLDYICANQVYRDAVGFGEHPNIWVVYSESGEAATIGPADKLKLAPQLLDFLVAELA